MKWEELEVTAPKSHDMAAFWAPGVSSYPVTAEAMDAILDSFRPHDRFFSDGELLALVNGKHARLRINAAARAIDSGVGGDARMSHRDACNEPVRQHTPGAEIIAAEPSVAFRRERIATAVLAGFAAYPGEAAREGAAALAVAWADALIAELDK